MIDTGNDERQQTKNKNADDTKIDGDYPLAGPRLAEAPDYGTTVHHTGADRSTTRSPPGPNRLYSQNKDVIDTGNDEAKNRSKKGKIRTNSYKDQTGNRKANLRDVISDGSQEGAQTPQRPHQEAGEGEGDGGGNKGRGRRRRQKQEEAGRK